MSSDSLISFQEAKSTGVILKSKLDFDFGKEMSHKHLKNRSTIQKTATQNNSYI